MNWNRIYAEERRKCELWLQDPLTNPDTGRSIERNGPTFKSWCNRCKGIGKPVATRQMTWSKCQEWRRNPTINPETGRQIVKNGKLYRQIEKQCKGITEKPVELLGEYYKPDRHGIVPTVLYRQRYYIVRKYNGRKIWGPLNKPAYSIILHFYKDTWDYKYSTYRPIYMGVAEPVSQQVQHDNNNRQIINNEEYAKNCVNDIFKMFVN